MTNCLICIPLVPTLCKSKNLMFLKSLIDHNVTWGILCTTATLLSLTCITYYIVSDHHSKVDKRRENTIKKGFSKVLSSHEEAINSINHQIEKFTNDQSAAPTVFEIAVMEESIMKCLESLDSISFASLSNADPLKEWRRSLIYKLQVQIQALDLILEYERT